MNQLRCTPAENAKDGGRVMGQTRVAPDFAVTDKHRQWALKKGWPEFLPDTFISEFVDHHEAKGTKMANWNRALCNWIIWASPAGRFYFAADWERHIGQAAQLARRAGAGPLVEKVQINTMRSLPSDGYRELRKRLAFERDLRQAEKVLARARLT